MNNFFKKLLLVEEIKAFANRGNSKVSDKLLAKEQGEGYEVMGIDAGRTGLDSFNTFYNSYLNQEYKSNVMRINNYRSMSSMPEIADVIEDAANEATQENDNGNVIELEIVNEKLFNNENITKIINKEFDDLMFNQLNINLNLWKLIYDYMIDGMLYYERIININQSKEGIKGIKRLPPETMDFIYNYQTGKVEAFIQYKKVNPKRPKTIEEARKDDNIIVFVPEQIGFIPYRHGRTKNEIFGYLENCKVAYNQLKLMETSVIIYRLVRAPERFVFKIDVGNMPKDKALKYVNKIKTQMNRKQSYNPSSGLLEGTTNVNCIRQNTNIKLLDGRHLPLIEVIKEFNDGKENWVYSINQETHAMEPNKIINAAITRKNEKLIRIHLDDGAYFDTTYDHKWIMRDGSEVRADQLKEMDSLMPLYTKKDMLIGASKYKQKYEYVYDLNEDKWVTTHKLVCESSQRKRKNGECIHHEDHNPFNNNPTNLILMDFKKHIKYHGKCTKQRWEEDYDLMYNAIVKGIKKFRDDPIRSAEADQKTKDRWYNMTPNEYQNACQVRHDGWMKRMKDPVKAEETRKHTIYWNKKLNKTKKLQEAINLPHNREHQKRQASKLNKEYWAIPGNKEKASNIKTVELDFNVCDMFIKFFTKTGFPKRDDLHDLLTNDGKLMEYWKSINEHKIHQNTKFKSFTIPLMKKIFDYMKIKNYTHLREICNSMPQVVNHKVAKIEYLTETDDTGCITVENNHNFAISFKLPNNNHSQVYVKNSMLDDVFIPQSDNRGSDVTTIGGNSSGFTELQDIHYFAKKLYRSLKYPISRIEKSNENNSGDSLFRGASFSEISRDEIKWAKFLERQQNKFCTELEELFLLHLEFKGIKQQYKLDKLDINIVMMPPSDYREQMRQQLLETRFSNYTNLATGEEFSKTYLMKTFLHMDEDEIKANSEGFEADKKWLKGTENDGDY